MSRDLLADLLASQGSGTEFRLAVVSVVSPLAVTLNEATVSCTSALGSQSVQVGDVVLVAVDARSVRAVLRVTSRSNHGTITAVGASTASVTVDGTTHTLEWAGATPSTGRCGVVWDASGGFIVGKLSGSAATAPTVPGTSPPEVSTAMPTQSTNKTGVVRMRPSTVCSSRPGSWRTDASRATSAWQGTYSSYAPYTGWFFYGGGMVRSGATVTGTPKLTLVRGPRSDGAGSYGSITAHVYGHTYRSKPSSPGSLTSDSFTVSGIGLGAQVTGAIPTAFAQKLLSGALFGLAVYVPGSTDYGRFVGPTGSPTDPDSGYIEIPYEE